MPYRAPELFDVKTGRMLDEKVDIWVSNVDDWTFMHADARASTQSLGCTLFAVAYNYSPFEDPAQAGGSIAMAVSSGRYKHPAHSRYSKGFK